MCQWPHISLGAVLVATVGSKRYNWWQCGIHTRHNRDQGDNWAVIQGEYLSAEAVRVWGIKGWTFPTTPSFSHLKSHSVPEDLHMTGCFLVCKVLFFKRLYGCYDKLYYEEEQLRITGSACQSDVQVAITMHKYWAVQSYWNDFIELRNNVWKS